MRATSSAVESASAPTSAASTAAATSGERPASKVVAVGKERERIVIQRDQVRGPVGPCERAPPAIAVADMEGEGATGGRTGSWRATNQTCPFLLRMFVRDNEHHR